MGSLAMFSNDNNIDLGPLPDLPPMSQLEEIITARVHIVMSMYTVRGEQHRYTSYIANFPKQTTRIYY